MAPHTMMIPNQDVVLETVVALGGNGQPIVEKELIVGKDDPRVHSEQDDDQDKKDESE